MGGSGTSKCRRQSVVDGIDAIHSSIGQMHACRNIIAYL